MTVEGKAPLTHLSYFNFPQSVLGMNKSPQKRRNQLSQKNTMQSFQQLSPRKWGGNWREEKGRAVAVKANNTYIQESVRKRKNDKRKRALPFWGIPACPHSPSVPASPLCNFYFRSASSSVLEWHPLGWRRNTLFLKDSSDMLFHMPYTVGKGILYHFQLDINMCLNFRLLDYNQTRVI